MSDDMVKRLRAWYTRGETITGDVQLYLDAADEIERLRTMLRELIDRAWEEKFEDRHTVDSEIIGKIAAYLVAVKAKEG